MQQLTPCAEGEDLLGRLGVWEKDERDGVDEREKQVRCPRVLQHTQVTVQCGISSCGKGYSLRLE